ncbi:hypothetical protein V6N11_004985 [Hibiscus sabdariffa]|uniref:Uncharacterized protein n=1 Tax=Hibiscus sabdariffa TaxID=183260 RepID=A0ABR1ZZD8_9ROSI
MQGAEGLAATAWLALRFVRAACWVGYLAIIGMMAGTTDAPGPCGLCSWPHASLCATTGPLASLSVAALVEGFTSFRPITVVAVAAGRLAWLPSFFFAWCASMPLPMLRSLCFRPTLVLTADFVSSVRLVVGPVHWPAFRLVVAAIHADWSRGGCWACPGPWFALLPLLDYGASAPMVRFVPMAVVGCLRGGYSMVGRLVLPLALTLDLFTECRILYWNVPSARPCERVLSCFPSRRVLSCFPSHPFWAGYGDLTFTAEEQDAILVAPDSVAIPAEDFACSLVVADDHEAADVADPADPVLDPPGLAFETSAQSDPAGPEVRADPNAEVRVNPSVAPTATAPAAPEGPAVPATAAPAVRKGQAVPATAAPMVRKGQAVPATAAPMADGEDFVNEAIPEAADSIIREVAAKILGDDAPSDGSDPPIALAKMGPSPLASPPKSGLSKSAPAGLRRAAMPVVPEHQEFDEWCAARSRTPPANVAAHPSEARASSIPPPRPHKRQAPSSDPSRAKRSRASASSSSRIPSSTKAGMSSVNNSPAETARQSRREK